MNGHARDDVVADIAGGRPTLSRDADALALSVIRLLTFNERELFASALAAQVAASSAWSEWIQQPTRYLADFDAPLVAGIITSLEARLRDLRDRAAERGWEVPE